MRQELETRPWGLLPTTIVQFNGGFFWSYTQNGTNWNFCNATAMGPCFVKMAAGQQTWSSDPFVAAAGGGIVAAANLAVFNGTGIINGVVVAISNNNGVGFQYTVRANDVGDSGCGNADISKVDQPAIAFDPSTGTPTLWVVWRYKANT